MNKLNIFMGNDIFEKIEGDIIALDFFANTLIDNNYRDFVCIGDFDSGNNFQRLEEHCTVIKHPCEKDEGDLELALIYAKDHDYDIVRVYNLNAGNRIDHFFNNIKLLLKYYKYYKIEIIDRYNYGYIICENAIVKKLDYKYVSFFPLNYIENLYISDDFKYSYNSNANIFDSFFISNELVKQEGVVNITNGNLLILFSND